MTPFFAFAISSWLSLSITCAILALLALAGGLGHGGSHVNLGSVLFYSLAISLGVGAVVSLFGFVLAQSRFAATKCTLSLHFAVLYPAAIGVVSPFLVLLLGSYFGSLPAIAVTFLAIYFALCYLAPNISGKQR